MIEMEEVRADGDVYRNVYLGGENVSMRCVAAYLPVRPGVEAEGWVDLIVMENGSMRYTQGGIAIERKHGIVRWERIEESGT